LEVLETSKPTAPKPKPEAPKPKRRSFKRPPLKTTWAAKKQFRYTEADIDKLTDEELEIAIISGDIRFDEEEL